MRAIVFAACLLLWSAASSLASIPQIGTVYVAPNGNDRWSGSLREPNAKRTDGPFATLERARDEIRARRRAGRALWMNVSIQPGTYRRTTPLELTEEDSRTTYGVYAFANSQAVHLTGGVLVTNFRSVTDPAVLARMDEKARGKVVAADLKALGLTDFGTAKGGGLELFFEDKPMTMARWPNQGFTHIVDVTGGQPIDVRGTVGDAVGKFAYEGDRPSRWAKEKDIWLHGYWFWDWGDERQQVQSIDPEHRTITLAPPNHVYGYRKGQWYYAYNLLPELDTPGEWCLDREAGVLYFWPPAPLDQGRPTVSVAPSLVTLQGASNVTLRGFAFEAARNTAVTIEDGTRDAVSQCTFRNLGGDAVSIRGGVRDGVADCDIYNIGGGGITLDGGDRRTLTPSHHYAVENHIHHYARWYRVYHPAVSISGVGQRVANNEIHDAPHEAIAFAGNDHVIEYNDIHDVCQEANDAGAIYAGRDWTWRGTVIRFNRFRNLQGFEGRGCVGVYLDDMLCGTTISGNIFYRVTMAAFIGGGRDNRIENNLFVDCKPSVHVDARATNWAADSIGTTMRDGLQAMPYQQPPWSTRYPQLLTLLDDDPAAPKGNVIARNVSWGGTWDDIEGGARPLVRLADNLVGTDPHFVDAARLDFRLRKDSPAWKLGFQRIPVERIGRHARGK